ncbi:MAG: ScaI family restriction endonuclease [Gemmataceae bacterium]|nr:ScaI family restriction endonuclease [Gemmataceae bacterium]
MTTSPYAGKPKSAWLGITQQLVNNHPLKPAVLLEAALSAWTALWQTTVGAGPLAVRLADLRVPATIVGYFFEVLLARELERRDPKRWRGTQSKDEKDLVHVPDPALSVEIKTSGQAGFKVYGNRSYGQKATRDLLVKKEKSGFYITVNFFNQALTLIRFGWIDAEDWDPQEAPTGQMAGLKQAIYDYKLVPIPGSYRQQASVRLLDGVGSAMEAQFAGLGIHTIGDLLRFQGELPGRLSRVVQKNKRFLDECTDTPPH